MWDEKRVGIVREVSSSSVTVVVDPEITTLSRKIGAKIYHIGQIGTYVLIPVGQLLVLLLLRECNYISRNSLVHIDTLY